MELKNRIYTVVVKHPVEAGDIYITVGELKIEYNRALRGQINTSRREHDKQYYFTSDGPASTSPEYIASVVAAESSKKKKFWSRTVSEWQDTFDSACSEHLRTIVACYSEECSMKSEWRYYMFECPLTGRENVAEHVTGYLV